MGESPRGTLWHHSSELQAAAHSRADVVLTHTSICADMPGQSTKGQGRDSPLLPQLNGIIHSAFLLQPPITSGWEEIGMCLLFSSALDTGSRELNTGSSVVWIHARGLSLDAPGLRQEVLPDPEQTG